MIILINEEEEIAILYTDTGKTELSFSDIDDLETFTENKNLLYINDAIEVTSDQVIDLIKNISVDEEPVKIGLEDVDQNDRYFLRSVAPGPLVLSEVDLRFQGPADMKELDDKLKSFVTSSFILQEMIKKKQLEILDEKEMKKFMRRYNRETSAAKAKHEAARDKGLDSIIVDKPAEEFADEVQSIGTAGVDAVHIDMDSDARNISE